MSPDYEPQYPEHSNVQAIGAVMPPSNPDAERSVIGGVLAEANGLERVAEIVQPEDFYLANHQIIFTAILHVSESTTTVDIITVADHLGGDLERVGGLPALGDMVSNCPALSNLAAYAEIVKRDARLRQMITVGREITDNAYSLGDADEVEAKAMEALLTTTPDGKKINDINSVLEQAINTIDLRYNSKGTMTGLPTGFEALDERTLGLQDTDLIVLAGRPSMGKTTLALNIAEHASQKENKQVMIFSMEMAAEQLVHKMISSGGSIPFKNVRSGKLEEHEWSSLASASAKIKDSPIYIDDRAALSISQVRMAARAKHKVTPLGLIVIDYIQLMSGNPDNRQEAVSDISRGLKALAKELGCPVLALSQLNRGLESRNDKRPRNSDLRDSGAIEQDADVIMFCYRDEVYDKESEDRGITEVITSKFRLGEIGTDHLKSELHFSRFANLGKPYVKKEKPQFHYGDKKA